MFTERGENGLGSRWDRKGGGREEANERKGGAEEGKGNHGAGSLFWIHERLLVCAEEKDRNSSEGDEVASGRSIYSITRSLSVSPPRDCSASHFRFVERRPQCVANNILQRRTRRTSGLSEKLQPANNATDGTAELAHGPSRLVA